SNAPRTLSPSRGLPTAFCSSSNSHAPLCVRPRRPSAIWPNARGSPMASCSTRSARHTTRKFRSTFRIPRLRARPRPSSSTRHRFPAMTLSLQGFHLAARSGLAFVLALSLSVLILGLSLLPAAAQSAAEPYRVGAGDVLAVMVYGETGLSGEFTVSPDGTIAYPILGNVPVAGLTSAEIAGRVDKALADYVPAPAVTATVARYAPVFIVGDVERPGRYEYRPGMTALELVALGGGVRRTPADGGAWLVAARQEYTDLELQI